MQILIVIAPAIGLIVLGSHAARNLRIGLALRTILGATLLISGITLIVSLPDNRLESHPVFYCLALVLIGLGINQTLASLIARFGRPA